MNRRSYLGSSNPNWKGGNVEIHDSRVLVYCPGHPEAKLGGGIYALRYRKVASDMLGRPLRDDEVVHHINGDPSDDRPENLKVTTQSFHARGHLEERRDPMTGRMLPKGAARRPAPDRRKNCVVCGQSFDPNPHHRVRQITCGRKACAQRRRLEGRYPHLRKQGLAS